MLSCASVYELERGKCFAIIPSIETNTNILVTNSRVDAIKVLENVIKIQINVGIIKSHLTISTKCVCLSVVYFLLGSKVGKLLHIQYHWDHF